MIISRGAYLGLAALAMISPASASGFSPMLCLFAPDCPPAETCSSFTVEIAPIDHEPGLWFSYTGQRLAVDDITPSDTPLSIFHAPGYEDNVMLTIFPTGEALHLRQYYQAGHGPVQDTAHGQCEDL